MIRICINDCLLNLVETHVAELEARKADSKHKRWLRSKMLDVGNVYSLDAFMRIIFSLKILKYSSWFFVDISYIISYSEGNTLS